MAKADTPGKSRILDHWRIPALAGKPIGCLATTFTFDAAFFEEECLSRFLGMESNAAEDGPIYLVEREEKLNSVECASVLVDEAFGKQLRNLRWDLIPVRLQQGIQHSKISVLYWENHLRILVGSANLTVPGYRKNQELVAVLDLVENNLQNKASIIVILDFLVELLQNADQALASINDRSVGFLQRARVYANSFPDTTTSSRNIPYQSFALITGPGKPNFFEQANKIWQERVGNVGPDLADIISPFFDPSEKDNIPAKKLCEIMRKKGPLSISFSTTGEFSLDEQPHRIHAPVSLLNSLPAGRKDITLEMAIIRDESASEKAIRPLHAKGYWFSNSKHDLYIIGSSNFTVRGLGLSNRPNLEANIGILVNTEKNLQLFKELNASWIEGEVVNTKNIMWQPLEDEELNEAERTPILPPFFKTATLRREKELFIELELDISRPVPGFTISNIKNQPLLTYQQWQDQQSPERPRILVEESNLPSFLLIGWPESPIPASMPVNIENQSCLPPPEELRNLPLDVLAELITSAKPVYLILKKYLVNKAKHNADPTIVINPLKRFNSSTFLLQRTRKYSKAINQIQTILGSPFVTKSSLEWRLNGPVGIKAIIEAMVRDALNASESVFFLTEIWKSLGNVQPRHEKGCLPVEYVKKEIEKLKVDLGQRIVELCKSSENNDINHYSKRLLESNLNNHYVLEL